MHEPLEELESQLDKLFGKNSPYPLPANTKKSIADATWWLALILGIIELWSAWAFWGVGHTLNVIAGYANNLSASYSNGLVAPHLGALYYFALIILLINAGILLLAVPALKEYKKQGWDLLYYGLLVNVVYGVLRSLSNVGGGIGQFIFTLFASAVAAYFLFQVRASFVTAKDKSK